MKKWTITRIHHFRLGIICLLSLVLWLPTVAFVPMQQDPSADLKEGKELFNKLCANCHAIGEERLGPPLPYSSAMNIDQRDSAWIVQWIHNSQKMVEAGDEEATKVFEKYNETIMPAFPSLTVTEIRSIGAYVTAVSQQQDSLKRSVSNEDSQLSEALFKNTERRLAVGVIFLTALLLSVLIILVVKFAHLF